MRPWKKSGSHARLLLMISFCLPREKLFSDSCYHLFTAERPSRSYSVVAVENHPLQSTSSASLLGSLPRCASKGFLTRNGGQPFGCPSRLGLNNQLPEEEEDEEAAAAASRSRIMCCSVMRIATTTFSHSGL